MIAEYFSPDRKIILPVAVFVTDGGLRPDGTWESSKFDYATGDCYEGRMQRFDQSTGYLLCELDRKFSV